MRIDTHVTYTLCLCTGKRVLHTFMQTGAEILIQLFGCTAQLFQALARQQVQETVFARMPCQYRLILQQAAIKIIRITFRELVDQNALLVTLLYGARPDDKVIFFGKVPQGELFNLTAGADVGLSIIENVSLSYYYALPNKLFEYIMADVPVIVSNLPQMEEIVKMYKIGITVNPYEKTQIEKALNKLTTDTDFYRSLKQNCRIASEELNWEKEILNLYRVLE